MNYRPIGHMQKQISSISETVHSSPNSSNSCTVQSLQYRFNTKLMSVRQIGHPRPSSRTQLAHVEQNRWCHERDPRVARCDQTHLAVVVVRLWCIDLTVGLAVDVDHINMISVVVDVDVQAVVVSITQPVAVRTDTDLTPAGIAAEFRHRCRTFNIKYAKVRGKQMQNYA